MFSLGREFEEVYIRGIAIQIPEVGPMSVTYADSFTACGIKFNFEGSVLTAETHGVKLAVVRENKGDIYGGLLQNADFNLYCYDNGGAVLFTKSDSYGLSTCGEMRYTLRGGKILPSSINPKE